MSYVVPLEKLGANDRARAGGKAVNLGVMAQNGIPIPAGFVITTEAYRVHLDA